MPTRSAVDPLPYPDEEPWQRLQAPCRLDVPLVGLEHLQGGDAGLIDRAARVLLHLGARRRGATMLRPDLAWRMRGAALFAAACGSSFMHRQVLASAAGQPASALEMGLGLASFILASLGMLLIVQGAHLSGTWGKELDHRHEKLARNAERVSVSDRAAGTRRDDAHDAATKALRRP